MADIQFSQTNNICFNDEGGSVVISQINLIGPTEEIEFASYSIQWSGDFDSLSQISADGRIAEFLKNGNYVFNIVSLINSNSILGPYNITITSPPPLAINQIKYNKYFCSDDGVNIRVSISGGSPPYNISAGSVSESTSETDVLLSGVIPGEIQVSVSDSNNCLAIYNKSINIIDSIIEATILEVLSPTLYDSYGSIKIRIQGYGPFNMWFHNTTTDETIYVDGLSTEYILDTQQTEYTYFIKDRLTPGQYIVSIKNNFGCQAETSFFMPNIIPLGVSLSIVNDNRETFVDKQLCLPIFDTILIPYKNIQNNTNLWQLIKNYNLKDLINITIDQNKKQYKIVRNMLDKYCLDENKIEILRLGNSPEDWFYYLYIAPSINLSANFNLASSVYTIFNPILNESYPLTLGLTREGNIDKENPSLIRGSFLINGIEHNQFVNTQTYINLTDKKNNAYISFDDSLSSEYDFFIQNISKKILKNVYTAGYVTSINFLEQFNRLNIYIDINQTACSSSIDEYNYMLQIKNLIKSINNLNNILSTYIYNIDNISKTGQIILSISGQGTFALEGGVLESNAYDISYYTFNEESMNLLGFYQNNEEIKTPFLKNIGDGYIIIKIKDKYNNTPRTVSIDNTTNEYDTHFTSAKNIIQKFNRNITPYFNYGDILCYLGSRENPLPPIQDTILPQLPISEPTIIQSVIEPVIEQTHDTSNTSSLEVNLYTNITCLLYGPKNYKHSFNTDITFTNMIPGVYRIVGSDKDLFDNNLYPQEFRIIIDKDTNNVIDINFVSYRDKVYTKEIV